MPPQRGARPPGTNDSRGPINSPYQPSRQSGRTRRPTSKSRDNAELQNIFKDIATSTRLATPEQRTSDNARQTLNHLEQDDSPPQTIYAQEDLDTIMTLDPGTPSPSGPDMPDKSQRIPQTPHKRTAYNPNLINQLTRTAREAFTRDDIRQNKIRLHFLTIAEALDAQLADAQKAQCGEAQALAIDLKETLQQHCTQLSIGPRPQPKTALPTHQNSS
ncbi:MAG: hypothetical protein M1839_005598 [Geoglossum umbratile]|nr:MAG: hypothetical protein M1839_005598 [Geoglossum umbratile]